MTNLELKAKLVRGENLSEFYGLLESKKSIPLYTLEYYLDKALNTQKQWVRECLDTSR